VGCQKSAACVDQLFYAARWYSLMRPPRTGRRLICFWVRAATGWAGRVEMAAAVGAASVVVGLVLGQDQPQMPLAEDQHPVGGLGPRGEHEPSRMRCAVPKTRARTWPTALRSAFMLIRFVYVLMAPSVRLAGAPGQG
jgi:hypothetical protein